MKEIFNKLLDKTKQLFLDIYKNKIAIIFEVVLILGSILFQNKITNFLKNSFAIEQNTFILIQNKLDVLYLVILSVYVVILYRLIKFNYKFSKYWYFWLVYTFFTYLIIRSREDLSFYTIIEPSIYYADVIFLIPFLTLIIFIRNFLSFDKETSNLYLKEDIPLDGSDKIHNERVVDEIVRAIKNFYPKKAFIIGINAKWGVGKTSFLNRLEKKLLKENKDLITLKFNVWQHQGENSILNNFFGILKDELSKFDQSANRSIQEYLNNLLSLDENVYGKGIKYVSGTLFPENSSIKSYYDKIKKMIIKTQKQFVVFVDDLDRLNKAEINETIRLLRNVADFSNVFFICGVDRGYIEDKGGFKLGYLDRFFNLEIDLPNQNEKTYLEILKGYIKETDEKVLTKDQKNSLLKTLVFSDIEDLKVDIKRSVFYTESNSSEISLVTLFDDKEEGSNVDEYEITPSLFFDSVRGIKRFYNKFIFNFQVLNDLSNVNVYDYVLFHLLIFKYPWFYDFFNEKMIPNWLLIENGNYFVLKSENEIKEISSFIDNDMEFKYMILILKELFDKKRRGERIRISEKRNLPIYLNNNIFGESLKYTDIIKSIDNFKIKELIQGLEGDSVEETIKDVKKEVIKIENLRSLEHIIEALNLINDGSIKAVTSEEVINIFGWAVGKDSEVNQESFKEYLDDKAFVKINSLLSGYLRDLNVHYSCDNKVSPRIASPYLVRQENGEVKEFELKIIDKGYVKNKLIKLFDEYLVEESDFQKKINQLQWLTEYYNQTLNFSLYYPEILESFKKNINENLNDFLKLGLSAHDFSFLGNIFNENGRASIKKKADEVSGETGNLTAKFEADLNKFLKDGLDTFILFLESKKNDDNYNPMESKVEEFIIGAKQYVEVNLKHSN